ncbi:MAG: helix-turn-helix transcriptional regulator [Spirochaetaceae bacterium]|jgi:transcriptional regulator with XRE-family HTH domain|nr:helix-turn-helix transcriptional regulator [Spirochaetaceae bacterium]
MEDFDNLREILAKNLRKNRRKCGFSQEKLAEKAGISTQYLAMMEIARKFPAQEVLERLAGAMEIKVYELFLIEHSPREELELLRKDIINEMRQTFSKILEDSLKCASK